MRVPLYPLPYIPTRAARAVFARPRKRKDAPEVRCWRRNTVMRLSDGEKLQDKRKMETAVRALWEEQIRGVKVIPT